MSAQSSPSGGAVATPPGGELQRVKFNAGGPLPTRPTSASSTPIWDELADRWAEIVAAGALVPHGADDSDQDDGDDG